MLVNVLVCLLGALIFTFLFWKRLSEDYSSYIIFTSAFYIFIGVLVFYLLSLKLLPTWFFYFELVGAGAGLSFAIFKFKIRPYEAVEAAVVSFLPWLGLFFLKDSVRNLSLFSFVGFLVLLILLFLFYYLSLHYKNLSWYKSGRIGFSGLATLGIFFLIRAGVAIFFAGVVSFVGRSETAISGALAFICFLTIFNLGRVKN